MKKTIIAAMLIVLGLGIGSIASAGTTAPSNVRLQAEVTTLQHQVATLQRQIGTAPANPNISTLLDKAVAYINCLQGLVGPGATSSCTVSGATN
jgi:hypothetical protein